MRWVVYQMYGGRSQPRKPEALTTAGRQACPLRDATQLPPPPENNRIHNNTTRPPTRGLATKEEVSSIARNTCLVVHCAGTGLIRLQATESQALNFCLLDCHIRLANRLQPLEYTSRNHARIPLRLPRRAKPAINRQLRPPATSHANPRTRTTTPTPRRGHGTRCRAKQRELRSSRRGTVPIPCKHILPQLRNQRSCRPGADLRHSLRERGVE